MEDLLICFHSMLLRYQNCFLADALFYPQFLAVGDHVIILLCKFLWIADILCIGQYCLFLNQVQHSSPSLKEYKWDPVDIFVPDDATPGYFRDGARQADEKACSS